MWKKKHPQGTLTNPWTILTCVGSFNFPIGIQQPWEWRDSSRQHVFIGKIITKILDQYIFSDTQKNMVYVQEIAPIFRCICAEAEKVRLLQSRVNRRSPPCFACQASGNSTDNQKWKWSHKVQYVCYTLLHSVTFLYAQYSFCYGNPVHATSVYVSIIPFPCSCSQHTCDLQTRMYIQVGQWLHAVANHD